MNAQLSCQLSFSVFFSRHTDQQMVSLLEQLDTKKTDIKWRRCECLGNDRWVIFFRSCNSISARLASCWAVPFAGLCRRINSYGRVSKLIVHGSMDIDSCVHIFEMHVF